MNFIDEINGDLWKLWKFWSVRWSSFAAMCSVTIGVYEGFKATDPALIRWVPVWIMAMLAAGAVLFTFASMYSRALRQPDNRGDNVENK